MGCAFFLGFSSCVDTVKIKDAGMDLIKTFGSENECKSGIPRLWLQRTETVQVSYQIISKPWTTWGVHTRRTGPRFVVCEVGMCGNLDAGLQGDGNC